MALKDKHVSIGGIIKHRDGIGFKITFKTKENARYYKDMMCFIIEDDGFIIDKKVSYYDKKK